MHVTYFLQKSSTPPAAIEAEIRPYMSFPGQALHKIGYDQIQELRKWLKQSSGDKFDLKGFILLACVGRIALESSEKR